MPTPITFTGLPTGVVAYVLVFRDVDYSHVWAPAAAAWLPRRLPTREYPVGPADAGAVYLAELPAESGIYRGQIPDGVPAGPRPVRCYRQVEHFPDPGPPLGDPGGPHGDPELGNVLVTFAAPTPLPAADEMAARIAAAAAGPASVTVGDTTVTGQPLTQLIAADEYLARKRAAASPRSPFAALRRGTVCPGGVR